jgi:AcrR family transcriptional regulator
MPAETRHRIVEAARRLFARSGYEGTSVAEIEKEAGLKPGAGGLYAHFDSKAAVLAAAIERSVALARASHALPAVMPLGDVGAELRFVARGALALLDQSQDLFRMLFKDADQFPELFADARERVLAPAYRVMAEWLAAKITEGRLTEHDPEAVADILIGALTDYWLHARLFEWEPNDVGEDRFIEAWVDLALRLAPQPQAATARRRARRNG